MVEQRIQRVECPLGLARLDVEILAGRTALVRMGGEVANFTKVVERLRYVKRETAVIQQPFDFTEEGPVRDVSFVTNELL